MAFKRSAIAVVGGRSGMANDHSAATGEDQIRALIDDRVKAVRAKDIEGAMSSSAPDIVAFDVIPPLQYVGLDVLGKRVEGWFSSFQGPIGHEICELNITAGDDVAFSIGSSERKPTDRKSRCIGARRDATARSMAGGWSRTSTTPCLATHRTAKHPLI